MALETDHLTGDSDLWGVETAILLSVSAEAPDLGSQDRASTWRFGYWYNQARLWVLLGPAFTILILAAAIGTDAAPNPVGIVLCLVPSAWALGCLVALRRSVVALDAGGDIVVSNWREELMKFSSAQVDFVEVPSSPGWPPRGVQLVLQSGERVRCPFVHQGFFRSPGQLTALQNQLRESGFTVHPLG